MEKALGAEWELLVHRVLTAGQATCALMDGYPTKQSPAPSHVAYILTRSLHSVQRAITAEKALGAEREALVHRALTAEQATCALMEQHARDSAALRKSLGHCMRL